VSFTFTRTPAPSTSGLATHRRTWRLTRELIEDGLQDEVNFAEFLFGFIDDVVLDRHHELILTVRLFIEFLTLELVGEDTGQQTTLAVTCGAGPNGNTGLIVVGPTAGPMQAGHSIVDEEHAFIANGTTGEILYSTTGVVATLARQFSQQDSVLGPFVAWDVPPQFFAAPPPPGSVSGDCDPLASIPIAAPLFGTIPFGHEDNLVLADKQDFFDLARAPFIDEALYESSGGTSERPPAWSIVADARFRFEATGDVTTSQITQRVVYRVRRLKVLLLGATLAESRFWLVVGRSPGAGQFVSEQYRILVIDGTGAIVRVLQDWRRLSFTLNGTQFDEGIFEWLGATRRHALWYQKTGDSAGTNAPREEILVVDWTTGETKVAGAELADFRAHDLQALAPDFLYEAQEDDEAKRFIRGWDPDTGAPGLDLTALEEDDDLDELKGLEDRPDAVIPDPAVIDPGPFGAFPSRVEKAAWQAMNDAELLGDRAIDEPELEEPTT